MNNILALVFVTSMSSNFILVEKSEARSCQNLYKKHYLPGRVHKAIATTGARSVSSDQTSCGSSEGNQTKAQAIKSALRYCTSDNKAHRNPVACKILEAK
jgi:hypothetical protein